MSTVIAQAPAPPAAPAVVTSSPETETIQQLKLELLIASPTNPRKTYDKESLIGLAENIKAEGIVQPIVVRTYNWFARNPKSSLNPTEAEASAKFEIVAGHRRVLAAKLAGLKTVPAVVRTLTDRQVIEIQITENEQREDVKAIEQGRGYKALVDQLAKEQPKATRQSLIDLVAARIGMSVRHVYARIKLGDLSPKVQAKVEAGAIEASHADLLVMLQPADQERAVKFLFERRDESEGARSVRELKRFIAEDVQCDLSAAAWKKDQVLDFAEKAGACSTCEKRTGANPKLHPEVKAGKDLCLDRACYETKRAAFVKVQMLTLQHEQRDKLKDAGATNAKVQAVQVARLSPVREWQSTLSKAEQDGVIFDGYGEDPYKIVKESAACATPAVIVEGPEIGHKRFVCLSTSGCKEHWATRSSGSSGSTVVSKAEVNKRKREIAKQKLDQAVELASLRKVMESTTALSSVIALKRVAWVIWNRVYHNLQQQIAAFLEVKPVERKQYGYTHKDLDKPIADKLAAMKTAEEVLGFALLVSIFEKEYESRESVAPVSRADVFKALKVDQARIRKELEDAAAAKEKAKAKPAAKKAPAGVCSKCKCTPQHRCVVAHVKGKPQTCKLVDGVCTGCSKAKAKKPAAAKKGGR
jgi:ParB/RepB/Spo0J family partition protein